MLFPLGSLTGWLPSARRRDYEKERQQRTREVGMRTHATVPALTTTDTFSKAYLIEDVTHALPEGYAEIKKRFSSA